MKLFITYVLLGSALHLNSVFAQNSGVQVENIENPSTKTLVNQEEYRKIHLELTKDRFPSARQCATCHPSQYQQWKMSPHAYAQKSPIFGAMHRALLVRNMGTQGDFCIRCHTPTGMQMGESHKVSNLLRAEISNEGITCVVCHRADPNTGTVSARFHIPEGKISDPINGPSGEKNLKVWLDKRDQTKGQLHDLQAASDLSTPRFCQGCHDVFFDESGFHLEDANNKYKLSPARKDGVTCQDCHMGKVQGANEGYPRGHVAEYKGKKSPEKTITNHTFAGPDFSVVDPTIFPHNKEKTDLNNKFGWTDWEWMKFDFLAGWGTDKFEEEEASRAAAGKGTNFDKPWDNERLRRRAAEVVQQNYNALYEYDLLRKEVMQNGLAFGEFSVDKGWLTGNFEITGKVHNLTDGHDVPTGFIAERPFWVAIQVRDKKGNLVFESGKTDPNGDYLDHHSAFVHYGHDKFPRDKYLFNLQSFFTLRNEAGSSREEILSINYSGTTIPFVRPAPFSVQLAGRPRGSRIHHRSLPALAARKASYVFDDAGLEGKGPFSVTAEIKVGMVPPNLLKEIRRTRYKATVKVKDKESGKMVEKEVWKKVAFDYRMSAAEIGRRLRNGVPGNWEYFTFPGQDEELTNRLGIKKRGPEKVRYEQYDYKKDKVYEVEEWEGIGGVMVIDRRTFKFSEDGKLL